MKKILILLTALLMTLTMYSCKQKETTESENNKETSTTTENKDAENTDAENTENKEGENAELNQEQLEEQFKKQAIELVTKYKQYYIDAKNGKRENVVLATVGDQVVYQDELDLMAEAQSMAYNSEEAFNFMRQNLFPAMVRIKAAVAEAKKLGFDATEEKMNEEIAKLKESIENKEFEKRKRDEVLAATKMTEEEYIESYRTEIYDNAVLNALYDDFHAKRKDQTDDQISVEFQKYLDEIMAKSEVKYTEAGQKLMDEYKKTQEEFQKQLKQSESQTENKENEDTKTEENKN